MARLSLHADVHVDPIAESGTIRRYLSYTVQGLTGGLRAVIRSRPPAHSRWIILCGEKGKALAPIGDLYQTESEALAYLEKWIESRQPS